MFYKVFSKTRIKILLDSVIKLFVGFSYSGVTLSAHGTERTLNFALKLMNS